MNKFKFKQSIPLMVMNILIAVLAVVGAVFNIINLVKFADNAGRIIAFIILLLVCLVMLAFAVWIYFFSYYLIEEDGFKLVFGPIKTVVDVKTITEICLFKQKDTLVVYFGEENYQIILIKKEEYDAFFDAVKTINPSIFYSVKENLEETKTK
jgi:hypothetical protein